MRATVIPPVRRLFSHLRYATQAIQNAIKPPIPGNYRPFKAFQDDTITLAHSDEPYMQKYGKVHGNRIPRTRT